MKSVMIPLHDITSSPVTKVSIALSLFFKDFNLKLQVLKEKLNNMQPKQCFVYSSSEKDS